MNKYLHTGSKHQGQVQETLLQDAWASFYFAIGCRLLSKSEARTTAVIPVLVILANILLHS